MRALIVDDQDDARLVLRVAIEQARCGCVVAGEAATGPQALNCIEAVDPDVVLLDQLMPVMNGLETAVRILERRPQQAIVLCSAYLDDDMTAVARAMGVRACVSKFDIGGVTAALQHLGREVRR